MMYSKTYLVLKKIYKQPENRTIDSEQLINSFLKKRYISGPIIRRLEKLLKKPIKIKHKRNYTIHPCTIKRSLSYLLERKYIKADYDEVSFSAIEITENGADFYEQYRWEKVKDISFHIIIPLLSAVSGAVLGSFL